MGQALIPEQAQGIGEVIILLQKIPFIHSMYDLLGNMSSLLYYAEDKT